MSPETYLQDLGLQLRKLHSLADRALAQLPSAALFDTIDQESNSIAVVMKHMAGNMRSRWTDFLTSDGEKTDRNRDSEFVIELGDSASALRERWDSGWRLLFETVAGLKPDDLQRQVRIRGEAPSVLQALQRQLSHYAYHVGQIVFLARHFAGDAWQSLSIPRGKSGAFEVAKDGTRYLVEPPATRSAS